jgi:hypothetical protein
MTASTSNRLSTPALLKAGGAAMLAAVLANVLALLLFGALLPVSPGFQPFTLGRIILFTVMFTLVGVIVFAVVNRFSANPLKVYNIIAVVAFFVSIIPNLMGAANPAAMPMGGASGDYLVLILFHIVAAGSFLGVLNYVVRRG